jgi:DNA-binding XRE family transcriptional regulator
MNWLWDRKISEKKVKEILNDPENIEFIDYASLLLSRSNSPSFVFKNYIDPIIFCKNWQKIKRNMKKNRWNESRIIFWNAVYEKIKEKLKKKGIVIKEEKKEIDPYLKKLGEIIKMVRKEKKLTQKDIAKKLCISQQLFSRIEKGKENITFKFLIKIFSALDKNIKISFRDKDLFI